MHVFRTKYLMVSSIVPTPNYQVPYLFIGTQELLNMVEAFNKKCTTYDDWLTQSENMMVDCGPIEADIERLTQQEVILEVNVYN